MLAHMVPPRFSLLLLPLLAICLAGAGKKEKSRTGTVLVRSATTGASIYIDQQLIGEVPMAVPLALRSGRHTIKVSHPGYADFLDTFEIKAGRDEVLEIDLVAVAGVLQVDGGPAGATVIVDGRQVGEVPYRGELKPGERLVELRAPGHSADRRKMQVTAGETYQLSVALVPLPPPPVPEPTPWYGRWWVWAGAAAVVAAGVTTALVLSDGDAPPRDPAHIVPVELIR